MFGFVAGAGIPVVALEPTLVSGTVAKQIGSSHEVTITGMSGVPKTLIIVFNQFSNGSIVADNMTGFTVDGETPTRDIFETNNSYDDGNYAGIYRHFIGGKDEVTIDFGSSITSLTLSRSSYTVFAVDGDPELSAVYSYDNTDGSTSTEIVRNAGDLLVAGIATHDTVIDGGMSNTTKPTISDMTLVDVESPDPTWYKSFCYFTGYKYSSAAETLTHTMKCLYIPA